MEPTANFLKYKHYKFREKLRFKNKKINRWAFIVIQNTGLVKKIGQGPSAFGK